MSKQYLSEVDFQLIRKLVAEGNSNGPQLHYMTIETTQRERLPMFSMNIIRKRMKEFELQRRKAMTKPYLNKPTKSLQTVICGKNFPRERTTPTATFKNCRRVMVRMAIKFCERPVWRSTSDTINSKVFIAIVKGAFGYNGISRRRMDTVILHDNAPVHRSRETTTTSPQLASNPISSRPTVPI
nr:unnamed protein product [Spirometra erinaceieuropaei]